MGGNYFEDRKKPAGRGGAEGARSFKDFSCVLSCVHVSFSGRGDGVRGYEENGFLEWALRSGGARGVSSWMIIAAVGTVWWGRQAAASHWR